MGTTPKRREPGPSKKEPDRGKINIAHLHPNKQSLIWNLILSRKCDCASAAIRHLLGLRVTWIPGAAILSARARTAHTKSNHRRCPEPEWYGSDPQPRSEQFLLGQPCTAFTAEDNEPLSRLPAFRPELIFLIDSRESRHQWHKLWHKRLPSL